jgi:hypothetical protein
MEGEYSCVCGRPCRTCNDTRLSIKVVKNSNDMAVTKAVSHTVLTYSKADSQPSYDLYKEGLLTPLQ